MNSRKKKIFKSGVEVKLVANFTHLGKKIDKGTKAKVTGTWSKGVTIRENGKLIPIPFKYVKETGTLAKMFAKGVNIDLFYKGLAKYFSRSTINPPLAPNQAGQFLVNQHGFYDVVVGTRMAINIQNGLRGDGRTVFSGDYSDSNEGIRNTNGYEGLVLVRVDGRRLSATIFSIVADVIVKYAKTFDPNNSFTTEDAETLTFLGLADELIIDTSSALGDFLQDNIGRDRFIPLPPDQNPTGTKRRLPLSGLSFQHTKFIFDTLIANNLLEREELYNQTLQSRSFNLMLETPIAGMVAEDTPRVAWSTPRGAFFGGVNTDSSPSTPGTPVYNPTRTTLGGIREAIHQASLEQQVFEATGVHVTGTALDEVMNAVRERAVDYMDSYTYRMVDATGVQHTGSVDLAPMPESPVRVEVAETDEMRRYREEALALELATRDDAQRRERELRRQWMEAVSEEGNPFNDL